MEEEVIHKELKNFVIDYEKISFDSLVSTKGYSETYKGTYELSQDHKIIVAIKKMKIEVLGFETIPQLKKESSLLSLFKHKNITDFIGVTDFPSITIVCAWQDHGNMQDLLLDPKFELNEEKTIKWAIDVIQGLAYLHTMNPPVIHKSIRAMNVLVSKDFTAKLSDFGFSSQAITNLDEFVKSDPISAHINYEPKFVSRGFFPWRSPELKSKSTDYDERVDIYSYGFLLWELSHRKLPTFALTKEQIVQFDKEEVVYKPQMQKKDLFHDLIEGCWQESPSNRSSIYHVMSLLDTMLSRSRSSTLPLDKPSLELSDDNPYQFSIGDSWKINYDDLEDWKLVAETNFSTVYKGKYKGRFVAIKTLEITYTGEDTLKAFESEVNFMTQLYHPNICLLLGVTVFPRISIITEWMDNGSLDVILLKKGSTFDLKHKLQWCIEVAQGLLYLHTIVVPPVIHRDLKAKNIFVDKSYICKIADFGLSRKKIHLINSNHKDHHFNELSSSRGSRRPSFIETGEGSLGTWPYSAPEIRQSKPFNELSDMYGYGFIMWEIAANKMPYDEISSSAYDQLSGQDADYFPEIPSHCDPEYKKLIKDCWKFNPNDRPNVFEAIDRLQKMKRNLDKKK